MKYMSLLPILALLLCACGAPQDLPYSTEASSAPEEILPPPEQEPAPPPKTQPLPPPEDTDFVLVTDYLPTVAVDLKYATSDNFIGSVIYDFSGAYLRYGTVQKLQAVMEDLDAAGYTLKIWDAFRPTAAQFKLWEVCPDPMYVSDPHQGFSSHSRGNTLDVTLLRSDGSAVEMPTGFDDFSALADRDYSDVPSPAADNARYLETVMTEHGFRPYQGEWWHFSDTDSYEVDQTFQPPQ